MDTKLTLKLDKYVVEGAKEYASQHKKSLSRLVESFLKSLTNSDNSLEQNDIEITPFVNSLKSGVKIPGDLDDKKGYRDYLMDKYK